MNKEKLWLLLAVPVIVIDRLVKWWAGGLFLALSGEYKNPVFLRPLIPGVDLLYARNTGAAFSSFSDMRWVLVAVSTAAAIVIILIVCKSWVEPRRFSVISLGFVLGGAVGNLIDRAFLGYVVDMFEFTFVSFAVFNIADIFITAGGLCFCFFYIFYEKKRMKDARMDANG